jgi:(1->4)-alpha-D-glucan 1-alpha-D-glucosylmutase
MRKAAREAGVRTDWRVVDAGYEDELLEFVAEVVRDRVFMADFRQLEQRAAHLGMMASLSQVVLKTCSPGVPDVYWGSELWDLRFVDPDNRRAVDYVARARMLEATHRLSIQDLMPAWRNGHVKLFILARLLRLRRTHEQLFRQGAYIPLTTRGAYARNVIAFARQRGTDCVVVVAARHCSELFPDGEQTSRPETWADTSIVLPQGAPQRLREVLSNAHVGQADRAIAAGECFTYAPVAVLVDGGTG